MSPVTGADTPASTTGRAITRRGQRPGDRRVRIQRPRRRNIGRRVTTFVSRVLSA